MALYPTGKFESKKPTKRLLPFNLMDDDQELSLDLPPPAPAPRDMQPLAQTPDLAELGNPEAEVIPDKKPGLLSRLFGKNQPELPPEMDELGVEKPRPYKQGLFGKTANIAGPALLGLSTSGVGLLPGALAGYVGQKAGEAQGAQRANEAYQKSREQAYGMKKDDRAFGLDEKQLAESSRHNRAMEALAAQKASEEDEGHILPAATVMNLSDAESIPVVLDALSAEIEKNSDTVGPIAGRLSSLNPWDVRAQTLKAKIKDVKQTVGKLKEGGVLRLEDEKKYDEILAGMGNDPKVARAKIEAIKQDMADKYNRSLENLQRSGYNTKKLKRIELGQSAPSGAKQYSPEERAEAARLLKARKGQ